MSNKYDLSQKEINTIQHLQNQNPVVKFLRTKDQLNFTVGDFLVRRVRDYSVPGQEVAWKIETVSDVSNVPKRFRCIHEDEYGIKYIKPLTSRGEMLPNIMMLTEVEAFQHYQVDPEYAMHMILGDGEEFDWAEQKKKERQNRERITRLNKKLVVPTKSLSEADAMVSQLKPGDKMWLGHTIPSAVESEPKIVKSTKKIELKDMSYWDRQNFERSYPGFSHTWEVTFVQGYACKSESFRYQIVILTEPHTYETL